jgi:hypothetical protein
MRSTGHGRWSAEQTLAIDAAGDIAMASTFSEPVLVAQADRPATMVGTHIGMGQEIEHEQ